MGFCRLWKSLGLQLESTIASAMMEDIMSDIACIRKAAVEALTNLLRENPDDLSTIAQLTTSLYEEKLYVSYALTRVAHSVPVK